jgi:hypothetical protein
VSAWPAALKIGPLREWPGKHTVNRVQSPFRAHLTKTLDVLDRELFYLTANKAQMESAELLVAIMPGGFRNDGRPRADAKAAHPGVVLSLDSKYGALSYPCDKFLTWEDNLRAIALALEALRKVDRYGVTRRGEQYRGFLELESAAASMFTTASEAIAYLSGVAGYSQVRVGELPTVVRRAQRATHPDQGGRAEDFQRVSAAVALLKREGAL